MLAIVYGCQVASFKQYRKEKFLDAMDEMLRAEVRLSLLINIKLAKNPTNK